jgi:TM2 domain-containing membrane protein YozV
MICNNCGTLISGPVKYCNSCGTAVVPPAGDTSGSSPTPVSVSSLFTDPTPVTHLPSVCCTTHTSVVAAGACVGCGNFYCRDCLVVHDGRNFCRNCSVRLNAAPRPMPTNPQQYPYPQGGQPYQVVPPPQYAYSQPPAPYYQQGYAPPLVPYVKRKEPGLALFLSFFFPGLGQFYNGDIGKGIALMFAFWILVWIFIGWIFWIWAMVDAYQSANNINMGRRI